LFDLPCRPRLPRENTRKFARTSISGTSMSMYNVIRSRRCFPEQMLGLETLVLILYDCPWQPRLTPTRHGYHVLTPELQSLNARASKTARDPNSERQPTSPCSYRNCRNYRFEIQTHEERSGDDCTPRLNRHRNLYRRLQCRRLQCRRILQPKTRIKCVS
jgi:hypothetical protein